MPDAERWNDAERSKCRNAERSKCRTRNVEIPQQTLVYAGDQVLAWQTIVLGVEHVQWEHRDPSNTSFRTTNENGNLNDQTYVGEGAPAELDPLGVNAFVFDPYLVSPPLEENMDSLLPYPGFGGTSATTFGTTYTWDGIRMPADELFETVQTLLHGRFGIVDSAARLRAQASQLLRIVLRGAYEGFRIGFGTCSW